MLAWGGGRSLFEPNMAGFGGMQGGGGGIRVLGCVPKEACFLEAFGTDLCASSDVNMNLPTKRRQQN